MWGWKGMAKGKEAGLENGLEGSLQLAGKQLRSGSGPKGKVTPHLGERGCQETHLGRF